MQGREFRKFPKRARDFSSILNLARRSVPDTQQESTDGVVVVLVQNVASRKPYIEYVIIDWVVGVGFAYFRDETERREEVMGEFVKGLGGILRCMYKERFPEPPIAFRSKPDVPVPQTSTLANVQVIPHQLPSGSDIHRM